MLRIYRPKKPVVGYPEIYGIIGILLLLVARFIPLSRLPFWGCPLRRLTGYPCLSCGMTRSFDWFLQGRFLDSLQVNPLGFALAVSAVVGFAYCLIMPWRPPRMELSLSDRESTWARIVIVLILLANWGYLVIRTILLRQ
jgi:hypothetical protein